MGAIASPSVGGGFSQTVINADPVVGGLFGYTKPPPTAVGFTDESTDPNAMNVGQRLGVSAYNGVALPSYQNPYDTAGYQNSKFYQLATGDGETPWSKLANEQQSNLAAQGNDSAKAQANGAAAASASRLAQQGGLTSGARERVQEGAGRNALSMVQGNNQTASNNIANIGIQDAQQRNTMLGNATNQLTSMQAANATGANTYNQSVTSMLNQAAAANASSVTQTNLANQQQYNDTTGGLFGGGGFLGLG